MNKHGEIVNTVKFKTKEQFYAYINRKFWRNSKNLGLFYVEYWCGEFTNTLEFSYNGPFSLSFYKKE